MQKSNPRFFPLLLLLLLCRYHDEISRRDERGARRDETRRRRATQRNATQGDTAPRGVGIKRGGIGTSRADKRTTAREPQKISSPSLPPSTLPPLPSPSRHRHRHRHLSRARHCPPPARPPPTTAAEAAPAGAGSTTTDSVRARGPLLDEWCCVRVSVCVCVAVLSERGWSRRG